MAATKQENFELLTSKLSTGSKPLRRNLGQNWVDKSCLINSTLDHLTSAKPSQFSIDQKDIEKVISKNNIAVKKSDVSALNSPVRRNIEVGHVAAIKGMFDKLVDKEKVDIDRQVKRLDRGCLKPLTPGSNSAKKRTRSVRKSKKKESSIDLNQPRIWEFYRGTAGAEKGSNSSHL